jgi:hypothetical protein
MQSIVLELWIKGLHFISIMRSLIEGTGAPTSLGATGRTGSGFVFFFGSSSSSASSAYSSSSAIEFPSESTALTFSGTTTTSGSGGGGYRGARASSSASMLNSVNRRSGWFVADQILT